VTAVGSRSGSPGIDVSVGIDPSAGTLVSVGTLDSLVTGTVDSMGRTDVATGAGIVGNAAFGSTVGSGGVSAAMIGPMTGIIARKPIPAAAPVARRAVRAGWARG
jgi:hypothetical protein